MCHASLLIGLFDLHGKFWDIVRGSGHFGVAGFFVLSGFILTYTYQSRTWTIRDFFVNRFARVYPLYIFSIIIAFPIDLHSPNLSQDNNASSLILTLASIQSWFDFSRGRFNAPSWTISVEAFFYAIFPLLFWIRKRSKPIFLAISVIIVVLTPLNWHNGGQGLPANRLAEFILGMWIVDLLKVDLQITRRPLWLAIAFLVLGLTGHHILNIAQYEYVWMPIMAASAIYFLTICDSQELPGWRSKGWILAGEISYGVYLLHAPVQRYFRVAYSRFLGESLSMASPFVKISYFLVTSIVTIAAAYLVWKWIEVPGRAFLRRRLS